MITKDWLLEQAVEAEKIMDIYKLPSGTLQTGAWREARHLQEQLLAGAAWLEEGGLTEIEQLGPFGAKPIVSGQRVRIKKGSVITSMHPKFTLKDPKIARRDYTVVVHHVHQGWLASGWWPHRRDTTETHREQQISWAGEGGYWCYLDTKYVEII